MVLFSTFACNYPDLRPVKLRPSGSDVSKAQNRKTHSLRVWKTQDAKNMTTLFRACLPRIVLRSPVQCSSIQCHWQNLQGEGKTSQSDKPAEQT